MNPTPVTLLSIVGARPQLIKAALISRAIDRMNNSGEALIVDKMIHTGQHYDQMMNDIFFEELEIPAPVENLGISARSHGAMTGKMLPAIESAILAHAPDMVVLYGDTNSTLAGALAAAKLAVPVAHVEAGLRSFNLKMPEEVNRILSDHVSDLLFCPTVTAVNNLLNEGIEKGVHLAGDVMLDAVNTFRKAALAQKGVLADIGIEPRRYALATVHRAENTDDPERLEKIFLALCLLSRQLPVIVPLHPRTRQRISAVSNLPAGEKLFFINPVSYLNMMRLEMNASVILTDSGGVQKEAYFHKVPCVTLRDETEWEETVAAGWNQVAGVEPASILDCVEKAGKGVLIPEYGNGDAAMKILKQILDFCQYNPPV